MSEPEKGEMSIREAARRGGAKTWERHGAEHYQRIGRKGGQRSQDLVRKGKEIEAEENEGG